jgi:peptidoglycan/xylan/chitin deacetylase (PgdA/CDA1 family)
LAKIIGANKTYFLPSGTPKSNAIIRTAAAKSGYRNCITYDVDSLDYQDPKPQKIIDKTLNDIQAGSIVSLHLGHKNTVAALPKLIQGIKDLGLEMVTLTELLGKP